MLHSFTRKCYKQPSVICDLRVQIIDATRRKLKVIENHPGFVDIPEKVGRGSVQSIFVLCRTDFFSNTSMVILLPNGF